MEHIYDVLIVGGGAAGMLAAQTVVRKGLTCAVLEKGKTAALSNGARCGGPALADTKTQEKEEIEVSPQMLYQHMYHFSRGTVNAGLLRKAVERGREVERIFAENQVSFTLMEDNYGAGFRARHFFCQGPAQRWKPLTESLERMGGRIFTQMAGEGLILSENGRAAGVRARNLNDNSEEVFYGKAVIIASGGYLGNPAMIREHFGAIQLNPLGNCLSDGTGINMMTEAGGVLDRNWGICSNEFGGSNHNLGRYGKRMSGNMLYAICGGLLVNRQGRRFMNEQYMSDEPLSVGGEICLREGRFYAVLDEKMYWGLQKQTLYQFYGCPENWYAGRMTHDKLRIAEEADLDKDRREGWAGVGKDLRHAADSFGLPELEKTVEQYNQACKKENDEQFGKSAYLLKALEQGPYYIFEYEPSAWCTFGGVKTDDCCRVLNKEQEIIPGLYTAGVDNGSCYCVPYYDNEGAAAGLAFTTGILAGEQAVIYVHGMQ